jgi:hypothetical protein
VEREKGSSRQNPLHHMGRFHAGRFLVEALEAEAVVVHAEAVEDGGVEVADVDGVFNDLVGVVVGDAVAGSGFHSAAGEPCAEATERKPRRWRASWSAAISRVHVGAVASARSVSARDCLALRRC